jgi:hypothetical protein
MVVVSYCRVLLAILKSQMEEDERRALRILNSLRKTIKNRRKTTSVTKILEKSSKRNTSHYQYFDDWNNVSTWAQCMDPNRKNRR